MQELKTKRNIMIYRFLFVTLALVLITTFMVSGVFARYKSIAGANEEARVAKFGNLNLYEYDSSGNIISSGLTNQLEEIIIYPGIDINKKLEISYTGTEVATYVFFVINTEGWQLTNDEEIGKYVMSLNNEKDEYIAKWTIQNNFQHLESLSSENRNIFYYLAPPNSNLNEKILDKIEVNAIGLEDAKKMEEYAYEISFEAYAASAINITPEEAFTRAENNY